MCYNETIERNFYMYTGDIESLEARFSDITEDISPRNQKLTLEDDYETCNQSDEGIFYLCLVPSPPTPLSQDIILWE